MPVFKGSLKMTKSSILTYLAWVISITATLGSLFFSEVLEYPPCVLCWYQRIAMYPLVILFLVGEMRSSKDTVYFSFPLAIIGWLIALYHNLLHYEIVPETLSPCLEGASCSTVYIELFGFLTIPMMSLISFTIILILLINIKRSYND